MENLLESYLQDEHCISKPKIRHINNNYINSTKILFTYSSEYSIQDIKEEICIWDLLLYLYNRNK